MGINDLSLVSTTQNFLCMCVHECVYIKRLCVSRERDAKNKDRHLPFIWDPDPEGTSFREYI